MLAYGSSFDKRNEIPAKQLIVAFHNALQGPYPELAAKPKVHMLHHRLEDSINLGPADGFCPGRYTNIDV